MTPGDNKPTVPSNADDTWAAPCGVCCRLCEFYLNSSSLSCGGCYEERICRVDEPVCFFIRCTHRHGVEHCGLCNEFPCRDFISTHQKCCRESPQIAVFRIGDLAVRARMGTHAWLQAKLAGDLPDVCGHSSGAGSPEKERRKSRRMRGCWVVSVSFTPAPEAFGLHDIQAECSDASPSGLGLLLPESVKQNFARLVQTQRKIEVGGQFPTSDGSIPFDGRVVWHNLKQAAVGDPVRIGVSLVDGEE